MRLAGQAIRSMRSDLRIGKIDLYNPPLVSTVICAQKKIRLAGVAETVARELHQQTEARVADTPERPSGRE